MAGKQRQRLCRICRKRPPWRYKNCPPGICKRCYHKEIWPERLAMQAGEREMGDPDTRPMVYDGYYGCFVPVEDASFDVATTSDAIVELPWEPEMPEGASPRKRTDAARRRKRGSGP